MGIFDRINPLPRAAQKAIFAKDGTPKSAITRNIERALEVQRPVVLANVRRIRKRHPNASPFEVGQILERDYLLTVTGSGAAVGASAAIPAVGTVASLGLSAGATVIFLEATALFAQSIAELHGIQTEDPERAKAMVMALMLGEEGTVLLSQLATQAGGRSPGIWRGKVGATLANQAVSGIVDQIRKRFIRRFLASQGTAFLGRAIPFGIGAAVGGVANRSMGNSVINATALAFGSLPSTFPKELLSPAEAKAVQARTVLPDSSMVPSATAELLSAEDQFGERKDH